MDKKKRILIIEDDADLQDVYKNGLSDAGFEVFVGSDSNDCFELLEKNPDIILLDIILPGGQNGFDILETLKRDEKTAKIPVVILTNLENEGKTAIDVGACGFLFKAKTNFDEIVAKIHSCLKTS